MKRFPRILHLAIALLVTAAIANAQQGKAEKLYQQALYEMEGMGNHAKAIELFNQVVTQFPKEKLTAAKALLHLGKCYEKLGNGEAQKAYERIVREFVDQGQVVAEARARLVALRNGSNGSKEPTMSLRQIPGIPIPNAAISPDGHSVTYIDWAPDEIIVRDLGTGKIRRLNTDTLNKTYPINSSIFSPDGKQVAAGMVKEGKIQLCLFNVGHGGSRILYNTEELESLEPKDWSPDARYIAAVFTRKDRTNQITLVSVNDGSVRVLKSLDWRSVGKVNFSPDGHYLLYDFPQNDEAQERDIFLLATDGSEEAPLIRHPANDLVLGWTPDGNRVLFASDRLRGSMGIWITRVVNGKPDGSPELVKGEIGNIVPVGITHEGSLYYGVHSQTLDVYTAQVDFKTGKILAPPKPEERRFLGFIGGPDWSRDGKFLAFGERSSSLSPSTNIIIRSVESGDERKISPKQMKGIGNLRWSPDGRSLLVVGYDIKGRYGSHLIDLETAEIKTFLKQAYSSSWSKDGQMIFYAMNDVKDRPLVRRDLVSGEDSVLSRGWVGLSVAVSPNGQKVAFCDLTKSYNQYQASLKIIASNGGSARTLFGLKSPEDFGALAWTPDGEQLLFVRRTGQGNTNELWQIRIDGGKPQKIPLGMPLPGFTQLSVHPDGRRLAFWGGETKEEFWVMDNFLPKEGLSVKYTTPIIRQVWADADPENSGAPSLDGRYVAYVDWETGDLAVRDLATGEKRRVTNKGSWSTSSEFAIFPVPSRDGKNIVYTWFNAGGKESSYELRIVSIDRDSPFRVLYRNSEVQYLQPADWSPDGKQILTLLTKNDGTNQIAWVSVADGSARALKTLTWQYPGKLSLSPDGRYIAYDFPPGEDSPNHDIFLLSADGSRESPLVQHPANDLTPVWTPDGNGILFVSDRRGTRDAWMSLVSEGKAQGSPELIKSDIGRIWPMGFTRKGSYYYSLQTGMRDIYIATLDLKSGKLLAPPAPATQRFVGSNEAPSWSPDGKYLAYVSRRNLLPSEQTSGVLCIRSSDSGKERELRPRLSGLNRPRWSPSGLSILVDGDDGKNRQGLYEIDVNTGEVTAVAQSEPGEYTQHAAWSPDGKALFYVRGSKLFVRVLATGQDRQLHGVGTGDIAVSPNGKWVVFRSGGNLKIISASGGQPRELLSTRDVPGYRGLVWTPDSRAILFVRSKDQTGELWRVLIESCEAQKLGLTMDDLRISSLHPDGHRLAFSAGQFKSEVWVMENFLPKENGTAEK